MSNIIKFPDQHCSRIKVNPKIPGFGKTLLRNSWVCIVLIWPMMKFILTIDCTVQLILVFYYWNTPGEYAGWTFILHFTIFVIFTYFVSIYKPSEI
jgi:hypothetical protein